MRVACRTIADFVETLEAEGAEAIFRRIVYVDKTETPVDGTKRDAVKFTVVFQASAIIDLGEEGQYLLQVGEDCGVDYREASQELAGSERASELEKQLRDFCVSHELVLRPGVIGM